MTGKPLASLRSIQPDGDEYVAVIHVYDEDGNRSNEKLKGPTIAAVRKQADALVAHCNKDVQS